MHVLKQEEQILVFAENIDMEKNPDFFEENPTEKVNYFHKWVYDLHHGGFTFMEAIVNFCNEHDVEYEYISKIISTQLKSDLEQECISFNIMKSNKTYVATELF